MPETELVPLPPTVEGYAQWLALLRGAVICTITVNQRADTITYTYDHDTAYGRVVTMPIVWMKEHLGPRGRRQMIGWCRTCGGEIRREWSDPEGTRVHDEVPRATRECPRPTACEAKEVYLKKVDSREPFKPIGW